MPSRLNMRHAAMVATVGILLLYQNCAQAPSDEGTNSQASYQESLPFGYKATLDTVSFMSCLDIQDPVEKRAYFTLRVGAYANQTLKTDGSQNAPSGLTMTDEFRAATSYYTATDRARSFSQSSKNAGARLSLSIRDRSNYQSHWATSQTLPEYELDSLLPSLDSTEVAGPLATIPAPVGTQPAQMFNYFPGSNTQRLIEGSLRFYKSKGDMDSTRAMLEGNGILVAGYAASQDELNPLLRGATEASRSSVYGTGYMLSFSLGANLSGGAFSSGERRVLSSVQEKDLDTGQMAVAPGWNCSAAFRFMVVRPEDAAGKCLPTVDRFANATQQTQLEAIRRVLRVEDWFVDIANRCVVPKRTGDYCYGKNLGTRVIQYYATACIDNATQACPHYVSVCIRN